MKLALCLYKYFPYGGLQRDFLRILNECRGRGHDVHVYTAQWQEEKPKGVTITNLKPKFPHGLLAVTNNAQNRSFHSRLQKALAQESFDLVIGFNKMPGLDVYYGADFCYLGRKLHASSRMERLGRRFRDMYAFEKAVFGRDSETLVLSLSEPEKSVYQQYYGTPESRFHLLPATLDMDRKPVLEPLSIRARIRQELGVPDSDIVLLFIGSGFKTKGLDRALIGLSNLPPALYQRSHLVVIGEDNEKPFRQQAHKLDIAHKVRYLGGRTDIPELLSAGDLLVHPAYQENTGTVLLEAIASGLPVIVTNVCGYADHILKAQAGIVLPSPFEQEQFNQQLTAMLTSDQRSTWATNGIHYGSNPALYRMPDDAVNTIETFAINRSRSDEKQIALPRNVPWLHLRQDLANLGNFEQIMQIEGEVFREAPGRKTIRFTRHNQRYFLKTHTGVGWQEIIKNLVYFRLPVLGALNEWNGAHHLQQLKIDTLTIAGYGTTTGDPTGYGTATGNPAKRQSFIITEEISNAKSLEEFCSIWQKRPVRAGAELRFKRWLIRQLAETARRLHNSGANHRDFYLCHFLLQPGYENGQLAGSASQLFVIDLHRMQLRRQTPKRWKIKDVAGLHYSSMDLGLTQRDRLRFMKIYTQHSLRYILTHEAQFWRRVDRRAQRLYRAEHLHQPMTNAPVAQSLRSASTQL